MVYAYRLQLAQNIVGQRHLLALHRRVALVVEGGVGAAEVVPLWRV
jgi:hypothetical protein